MKMKRNLIRCRNTNNVLTSYCKKRRENASDFGAMKKTTAKQAKSHRANICPSPHEFGVCAHRMNFLENSGEKSAENLGRCGLK